MTQKIVKYQIVCDFRCTDFNTQVNELITAGFQPYGEPFLKGDFICQAMVKYAETN